MGFGVWGLRFGVWGSWGRVWGLGCRVLGLGMSFGFEGYVDQGLGVKLTGKNFGHRVYAGQGWSGS